MAYDFSELKTKITDVEEWLKKEFSSIRTGRATPLVLDSVRVLSYGTPVPINQVGGVTIEDARTLRIVLYDPSQIKEVENAIVTTNLGLSVSSDEKGVRVFFPELTADTRTSLLKVVNEKLEQARVTLRGDRDHVWNDLQKKEKDGEISEDEKFTYKEDMQKLIDEGNNKLDELTSKKEQELKG